MQTSTVSTDWKLVSPGGLAPERPKRNLNGLTGLRFFAAFSVVLYHFTLPALAGWPDKVRNIASSGFVAVSFFFLLSGFILSYSYLNSRGEMRGTKRSFYTSRFARIYPAYFLAFLLAAPTNILWTLRVNHLSTGLGKLFLGGGLVLALQQAWTPWTAWYWNFPAWSISVEAFFYLVFPFVGWRIYRLRPSLCLVAAGALWMLALAAPLGLYIVQGAVEGSPRQEVMQRALEFTPIFRLPEFLIGILLGRVFGSNRGLSARTSAVLSYLSVSAILVVLTDISGLPHALANTLMVPLFAILIYSVAGGHGLLVRALSIPAIVLLGEASYGIYIFQIPVAYVLRIPPPLTSLWVFAVYLAALVTVSLLSLRWVELPLRNRIRRAPYST